LLYLKKITKPNIGKYLGKLDISDIGENVKWFSWFGRQFDISFKTKHTNTTYPVIYLRKMKHIHTKNYAQKFIAALFIIDKDDE
jgi:hypothetical protein